MNSRSAPRSGKGPGRWIAAGMTLLTLAGLLGGCAAIGKRLETPQVSLSGIAVESATLFEMVMGVTLRVMNPNEVPLTLKGADIRLEINGKDFARGVARIETTVPPYGTALVPTTLYSSMIEMIQGILKLEKREALNYRVYGTIRIEGGLFLPATLPFSSEGELSMDRTRPET